MRETVARSKNRRNKSYREVVRLARVHGTGGMSHDPAITGAEIAHRHGVKLIMARSCAPQLKRALMLREEVPCRAHRGRHEEKPSVAGLHRGDHHHQGGA